MRRQDLERTLQQVAGFDDPRAEWEQYPTPALIAAHVVQVMAERGDCRGTVVDLGCGTGVLALAVAFARPERVVGIDRDRRALATARENTARVAPPVTPGWVAGDATRPPLRPDSADTVVMNPPFGAQRGNEHADRAFLATARELAAVSYSVHNEGSQTFVESFARDNGGTVTDAVATELDLPRQFEFHTAETVTIDAELFRIEW